MHKYKITYHHEFADGARSTPMTAIRSGYEADYVARCFVNSQTLESKIVVDTIELAK